MGKYNKVKKVVPYNQRERSAKILNLVFQISDLKMDFVLTPEIKKKFNDFIDTGASYSDCIDLPKLSRQMIINLINDKNQQTFINFKYVGLDDDGKCCDANCTRTDCDGHRDS
jgi:hypothetical protein